MKNLERILAKLRALDPRLLYATMGIVVLLFVAADYFLIMQFQISGIASQAKKNAEFKAGIEKLLNDKQHLESFQKGLADMKAKAADFDRMVYLRDDIPSALKKISTLAQGYQIEIDQLTPYKQGEEQLVKSEGGTYKSVAIFVVARGGYHEVGRFINRLENDRVFLKLEELDMRSDLATPQKHMVKMLFRIVVLDK